ncbi:glycosyltransferase [Pseudomonas luteola]|uniref:Glycosyltransferase family 4 protein n=1 Tax=Pseudomonas luteola TaxID=47886 RepID=A0ABS0MMR9_PSELU|nr:glycosyltransferase [Pseudomonas luteola]MBH3438017.1 glycosyltransferase family 4 protein [Pseudomonas luteola]
MISAPPRIDQYAPATSAGDGVTNGLFYTRKLLQRLGFASDIFSHHIPDSLSAEIKHASAFKDNVCSLLLYSHSMGHDYGKWMIKQSCKKAVVYHNITPANFFPAGSELEHYSQLGRKQLHEWREQFVAAIGDSHVNSEELKEAGYTNVATLPLLVDPNRLGGASSQPVFTYPLSSSVPVFLTIGRLVENKRQHFLIDAFWHLCRMLKQDGRPLPYLVIVGGTTSPDYAQALRDHSYKLGLSEYIHQPGKCSDEELRWLYQHASQYWCASEHEGFCMPLIEANFFNLPVVSTAHSNIPYTLGEAGLLIDEDSPVHFAAASREILISPDLHRALVTGGQRNLNRYHPDTLIPQLREWLATLGLVAPLV